MTASRRPVAEPPGFLARVAAPYRAGLAGLDRRIPLLALSTFLFIAARLGALTFLGIYFVRVLEIPVPTVGLAFLVENVVRGAVGPFTGALSDRIGRKPMLIASVLASAALMPAFLLVEDARGLFLWSAAIGIAQGPWFPSSMALLIDLAPVARRQSAMALVFTALALGYTLGVAPAGFLASAGYELLAAGSSGVFLLVALVVALAFRGPLPREPEGSRGSVLAEMLRAPRDPAFALFALLVFLFPLGIGLVSLVVPIYGSDLGLSEATIGLVLSASGIVLAGLALPANARVESRGPFRFLPVAAAFAVAAYAALAFADGALAMLVAVVVFTLAEVFFSAALPVAVAALAPPGSRGAYQGTWGFLFAASVGSALFLAGLGRDALGWRATWLVFAAATALAGLGLALARARLRRVADARAAQTTSTPASSPEA